MSHVIHLQRFFQRLQAQTRSATSSIEERIVRGGIGSLIVRVGGTGLLFLLSVVLTRLLGAAEFGIYAYVVAWMNVLVLLAVLGVNQLLTRDLAVYQIRSAYGLMHGQIRWSVRVVLPVSLSVTVVSGGAAWSLLQATNPYLLAAFWIGCLLLPITALLLLGKGYLHGFSSIVEGLFPELVVRPAVTIVLAVAAVWGMGIALNALHALWVYVVASAVALLVTFWSCFRHFPREVQSAPPEYERRTWLITALPLALSSFLGILNNRVSILAVGAMLSPESVGIYAAAVRLAELINFVLIAVNVALSPSVARLYAMQHIPQLQHLVTRNARTILFASTPIAAVFIFFGPWVLRLFGPEFPQGYPALVLLSIGQLGYIAVGSVGILLTMTGYERDAAVVMAVGLLLNIVLNVLLIPLWGIVGAALAASVSTVGWNMALAAMIPKRLGIHSTVLGTWRFPWGRSLKRK
ncbi:MAG: oligosaccharide flippase family protein [Chloroflexaceae bacterium]|nr:oligosaccharide flippase family protein [Chloroflexaceae bacterium]